MILLIWVIVWALHSYPAVIPWNIWFIWLVICGIFQLGAYR